MLTDIIGFLLSGVMLVFIVSFAVFGFALFKNKTDLINLSRKTMVYSFITFAVSIVVLQVIFR